MQQLLGKRIALITGKGGVGRTTLTAALAHVAQRAGKRVLVTEVYDGAEAYSPLAQLFGQTHLPATAAPIAPGILGSQLRPDVGVELFLASVLRVARLAKAALGLEPLRRLFLAVPSLRELGTFYHLLSYLRASHAGGGPEHELILVDMPATGHTLAMTGLPEVVLRLTSRGPIADALREGQSYLNAPELCGAWVVTLPEALPVSESLELLEGLARTAVPSGGVIVNRVPAQGFSTEEVEALRAFLPGREVFGAAGFHRSLEAQRAIERLEGATDAPVLEVREFEQSGPELVRGVAEQLEGARFRRGPAPAGRGAR